MSREESYHRFCPGIWVTVRETGEHIKIESWSDIAGSYRARSTKHGLLYPTDEELDEVVAHPEEHLGKYWARCKNTACGAPLTPGLPTCEHCSAAVCACGRCECKKVRVASRRKTATPRARIAVKAKA